MAGLILDKIQGPNDIKNIPDDELEQLCKEIRAFLLVAVSKNGGHLASNLGIVELTIAIHKLLDFPKDKLIFDVGHQSYVHKMLTGRKEAMMTLRQLDGISGFTSRNESDCDAFIAGHASTSVSAGLGYAMARDLNGTDEKVVVVIGDGSMTGGMVNEALNNCANLKSNMVIVLNDNERSISVNTGAMSNYLDKIRTSHKYNNFKRETAILLDKIPYVGQSMHSSLVAGKDAIKRLVIPGMLFEDLGITYMGPIDGHNIEQIIRTLNYAFKVNGPVLVHAVTTKGKGYKDAQIHPALYHGVGPFDLQKGAKNEDDDSYTAVFSKKIVEMARKDERIVAITAAMKYGTGLYDFSKEFPDRCFDVGIAEEHAVTFAAGLAAAGKKPIVAIYSTFLQRSFDQVIHDVCMQNLPVIFAIDRAGIVGNDGKTHNGVFDEAFLSLIPNMTVMSPKNGQELADMLEFAMEIDGPVAIRYSRGKVDESLNDYRQPIEMNVNEIIEEGNEVCLLATGVMVKVAKEASDKLKEHGINPTVVNLRFLNKIDMDLLKKLANNHQTFCVIEEVVFTGSYSERMAAQMKFNDLDSKVISITLPNKFIEHGTTQQIRERYKLTVDEVVNKVLESR